MSSTTSDAPYDPDAVVAGDRAAFEALVRHETPRLFRIIKRYVSDDESARGLTQETFLQAYKGLDDFRGDSKLTTWIFGIGINLARSHVRKRRREQPMDEDTMDRLQPQFRMGHYVDSFDPWHPEQSTERNERKQLVRDALDELSDTYREVIILRDLEERSTKETAELLDISRGAVRVRLHRARQALRSLLTQYFSDDTA
ncbi:RNA polymerase sigma factor [Salisaeta longa]|uniref:RNA polymerase sigma factor n=1 Tax=Salisaeta longa TaxID=503170 RepID=UPI0003B42266|nr:sigma-70 family RNA polymerase sigma factor [Salisaeta longa]